MSIDIRVGQTITVPLVVDDEEPASVQVVASSSDSDRLRVVSASSASVVLLGLAVGGATLGITAIDNRGGAGSVAVPVSVAAADDVEPAPPDPIEIDTPSRPGFPKLSSMIRPAAKAIPLRLGRTNDVPGMTLTATPDPVTPLDNLKVEHSSRVARFVSTTSENDIVISGTADRDVGAEYFALPNADLPAASEVKIELFDQGGYPVVGFGNDTAIPGTVYPAGRFRAGVDKFGGTLNGIPSGGYRALSSLVPAGKFQAGIDRYGGVDPASKPETFVVFFHRLYIYRSFRLTIRTNLAAGDAVDIRFRMLLMGRALELIEGFEIGAMLRYLSPTQHVTTGSGSTIPKREQRLARALSLPLNFLPELDRERLSEMEVRLNGQPFIVSAHPGSAGWEYRDHNFLARFSSALEYQHRFGELYAIPNFNLVEV